MQDIQRLLERAESVHTQNFPNTVCFERAVFLVGDARLGIARSAT